MLIVHYLKGVRWSHANIIFPTPNCGYTNSYVALHACIIIKLLILIDASRILYLLRGGIEPMSDKNNCAEAYN